MRTLPGLFFILSNFNKPAQTTEQLCNKLIERGLVVKDPAQLMLYLKNVGYYRLTGYIYPFQLADRSHNFKEDVDFELIEEHYQFDKELRLFLLRFIESIEISIRSNICNTTALGYGPHWYLELQYFNNKILHDQMLANINEYCSEASELFIKSYMHKYTDPNTPPIWRVLETFTLGQLTSLYENLKDTDEKKNIAEFYGCVPTIFQSWLKSINFIRNCCAHHSRLWNRKIPIKPKIPERRRFRFLNHIDDYTNQRIFGILSCTLKLLESLDLQEDFKNGLFKLFDDFPRVNKNYMGFTNQWEDEPIWIRK